MQTVKEYDADDVEKILLNSIHRLDKKIYSLEKKIQNKILENIDKSELSGQVEVPLIYSEEDDYIKEKNLRKKINHDIRVKNNAINLLERKEAVEEIEEERKNIEFLESQLNLIEEDSKDYLRHLEAHNFDYSGVKDKEVRKEIKNMLYELSLLKKTRKSLIKQNKKNDNSKKFSFKCE